MPFLSAQLLFNTLRPRQNGRHFPDDMFKCIFANENVWILIKFSPKFVPRGPINNIPALVQIMAWRRPGDKPLSELMMVSLLTHICVTRPQWVKLEHKWGVGQFVFCFKWVSTKHTLPPQNHILGIIDEYIKTFDIINKKSKKIFSFNDIICIHIL